MFTIPDVVMQLLLNRVRMPVWIICANRGAQRNVTVSISIGIESFYMVMNMVVSVTFGKSTMTLRMCTRTLEI